jgi:hypothetical protein
MDAISPAAAAITGAARFKKLTTAVSHKPKKHEMKPRLAAYPLRGEPMRITSTVLLAAAIVTGLFGGNPKAPDLPLIERLDSVVQRRFADPRPATLGMSRIAVPSSMGEHFRPATGAATDFVPLTREEREITAEMEQQNLQVGFYLFGAPILTYSPEALNFRALKGPAVITHGTPRPAWYPMSMKPATDAGGALPDWKTIYPLARRAMIGFQSGDGAFETTFEGWNIAARPVTASDARCLHCHSIALKQPIGGVIYAFRRAK